MEMKVGPRTIRASIARRNEARAAYDEAVRQGRRAALLEQERPNVFTFSVANIDAGTTIDVKLHYFEVASFDELDSVTVPTHATDVSRPAPGIADMRLRNGAAVPNEDFVFRWKLAAETVKPAIFTHRRSDEEPGYLSLLLTPSTYQFLHPWTSSMERSVKINLSCPPTSLFNVGVRSLSARAAWLVRFQIPRAFRIWTWGHASRVGIGTVCQLG